MDEERYGSGAGPAIAAHSKDASASAQTSASETGSDGGAATARDGIQTVKTSLRNAAGNARETLIDQGGRVGDQVSTFVHEQPFAALAITGIVFFALGALLARR